MGGEVSEPRSDRFVGLFYWTWHNIPRNPPMNNTRIFREHPEALHDVVIFDNTNGALTWKDSYRALMETFSQARLDGVNAPAVSFLLPLFPDKPENTRSQLRALYPEDQLDREILDFFTFRPGQASYIDGQERPDHWGWLSIYPQQVYRNEDGTPEQVTVGVAHNHSAEIGLTAMNGEDIFGRAHTSKGYDTRLDAKLWGANLEEQFEYALQVDPEFIYISGWNEWIAGRYPEWRGVVNAFPDQFDETGRNDIIHCTVQHDEKHIRLRVSCDQSITAPGEKGWMRLFLRIHDNAPAWEGFDYVVNRETPGLLERSLGGWNWAPVCICEQALLDQALEISVPRSALALKDGPVTFAFKWSDHMMQDGDSMDFYLHGDCAPGGRFVFCYRSEE